MSNVTEITKNLTTGHVEGDCFEYVKDENDDLIGVTAHGITITISPEFSGSVDIELLPVLGYSREKVAEFLWAAACFLDSEERYRTDGDMVGIDYE